MIRQFAIFRAAFLLGLRGFGGPAAHLRLFSEKLVKNKKWVSEAEFEGLVSLAALLPGPTSSQVGLAQMGSKYRRYCNNRNPYSSPSCRGASREARWL
jgi:chromate transport protein ChrA